ncbi:ABC transporter substrate-binding protein [Polaromonas sp. P1-6]|nr:ABC transporter substrate-binding protein [Polaromonas sp. P1-6]
MTIDIHFKARRTALAVIGLTAALLVSPLARAQGAKVLKLGSILTVTGPNASIGKEGLAGVEYAIKQVNAAGGVRIGSDTYTVQLVNIDDESKQERAVAAAERLISSEKVPVIFTTPASTTTLAVLPTLEKNKTVGMSFVAAAPAVISPELSYSFRSTLSAIDNVGPSIDFLVKDKGLKRIAYLGRNDDWGRAAGKAVAARVKSLGGEMVVEEYFETGNTDFSGLLTKVRGANADAVLGAAFIEDGVAMIKQYREQRLKPVFLSPSTIWSSPTFLKAAGKAAEGVYVATGPTTTESPALTAFGEQFEKTTGRKPLPFELIGYDNVMIVLDAMKKAGSTDAIKVRDALRNVSYQGVLQEYKFGGTNQAEVVINVNEIKEGRARMLTSMKVR